MAGPGDINWNGQLLPASLRGVLGMPEPELAPAPAPDPYAPPPVPMLPPSVMDMLGAAPPSVPIQNGPDYPAGVVDNTPRPKAKAARPAPAPAPKQPVTPAAPRMPTLAGTMQEQQAATGDALAANQLATETAQARSRDEYGIQQQAQAELKASQDQLRAQQEESDKVRADKTAHVDAMMREVDSSKIDQSRYWKNAGTGKKVGWLVSMALSGLGDLLQKKSGPNPVIGMFEATIDKDVRQQAMDRDALKEKLGRAREDVDQWDRFSSNQEARILAQRAQAKEYTAQQLLTASSKYGSEAALANGAAAAAELRKSAATDAQKAVDMAHGHKMQEGQLGISRQQVGIAGANARLAREQFTWSKQKDAAELELEAQKLAGQGNKKDAELVQKFGVAGVTDKDGNPFIAQGTPEGIEKLRDKVGATRTLVRLLDEARRIRTGWTSDTAKSKEWQELKANWAAAQGVAKDVLGLGALSGPDMDLVNKFIGSDDPTAWRDPEAGITKARKNVINMTRDALGAHGDGAKFDIPDIIENGGPKAQPGDDAMKNVLADPTRSTELMGIVAQEMEAKPEMRSGAGPATLARAALDENGGMLPSQKQALDTFAAGLRSPDPKVRDLAASRLGDAANSAQSEGVRGYAAQLLTNNMELSSTEDGGGGRFQPDTVRDVARVPAVEAPRRAR